MPSRPAIQSFNRSEWSWGICSIIALILFLVPVCQAQITNVTDTTSTPVPGAGHNYLGILNEMVNPANGSVSVRFVTPVPPGRKLTVPFSFAYNSSGLTVVPSTSDIQWGWESSGYGSPLQYSVPTLSYSTVIFPFQGGPAQCEVAYNYVFTDASGVPHPLYLSIYGPHKGINIDCSTAYMPDGAPVTLATNGGDGIVQGYTPEPGSNHEFTMQKVWVADADGTVVTFTPPQQQGGWTIVPDTIEDRNGNVVTINHTSPPTEFNSYTDTLGRTSVSISGTNPQTISVSGVSPYTANYGSVSASGLNLTIDQYSGSCPVPGGGGGGGSATVMTSLTLPNGKAYQFSYDPNSGYLSKIVYPTGGYVRYVWGVNSKSESGEDSGTESNGTNFSCAYYYDTPVVTDRYVSFDGSTEVLHQHFDYSTTWETGYSQYLYSQKKTTVTTYDLVRGGSYQTVYTYSGSLVEPQPSTAESNTNQMPVESQIQYYDWNSNGGSLLKTVNKTWQFELQNEMLCESVTLGSVTSRTDYAYTNIQAPNGLYIPMALVTDKKEWDWGTAPPCGNSTSGTPLRETVTGYNGFTTPIFPSGTSSINDKPSQVTVYGSGTQIAQTTYAYTESVSSASVTVGRDSNYNANSGIARGNTSSVTRWLNTGGSSPVTTYTYDDTGQVLSKVDPCGNTTCSDMTGTSHTTTYSYTDSYSSCGGSAPPSGSTNAYLTQVTNALGQIGKYCYGYDDGQLRGATDPNSETTIYKYIDNFRRLTETDFPDGGKTTISYNDTAPTPSVTTSKEMNSSQSIVSTTIANGIGLSIESELTSDPQGTDSTVTSYDGSGRAYTVTNPYRSTSDPTYGVTTYTYDALGRTTSVAKPDGSTVSTSYLGNCTTVTDEAGKNRESCSDGLGRMTQVIENPGRLGYTTNYTYDALNNLLSVVQSGSHNRSFTYDSLSRLLNSANPETGTVTYSYDANGNVTTKIDARSITTTNSYDVLNRITGVTYSNNDPSVTYTYDQSACLGQPACYNIGHRTTMTDAGGTENLSYDSMGRELAEKRTTNSVPETTTYGYDMLGDITSLTYPAGRTITYTYDSAGRPAEAQDTANNINYAQGSCADGVDNDGVCYAPNGSVAQMQNGTNLISTYIYNKRFQPCWFYATTGTALPTNTTCTATDPGPGNILDLNYNFNLGAGDNGNVIGITNNQNTTRSQGFSYDALNRIVSGQTTSTYSTSPANCWGEAYQYDNQTTGGAWGNLTSIGAVSSAYNGCVQENLNVNATANNQLSSSGYSYDAAGNMTSDAAHTYTYNAESEIKSAAGVGYTYDGDGNRLDKCTLSGSQCQTVTKLYWYGAGTEILDESDGSGNFTNEYVFFGGKRVAMRNVSSGTIYYYAEDMLGSSRTIVQAGQTSPCYDADFYPFGGERIVTNSCTQTQNYKFEGKERDTETGNDDFGARYYNSRIGRWLSADWSSVPVPVPYANLANPQTLNLYAMVSDNPETFADLNGHCPNSADTCQGQTTPNPVSSNKNVCNVENGKCDNANTNVNGNDQDKAQQKGDQPPSWTPDKPLPKDPTGLGPDWKKNPEHKDPNGEEYINDKTGERVEWNKGRPGQPGNRGKDHWHYTPPGGERGRRHLRPGEPAKRVIFGVEVGLGAYITYRVARMIPSLFPPLWETIPANAAIP
jgi:RHS repeat-associated protein